MEIKLSISFHSEMLSIIILPVWDILSLFLYIGTLVCMMRNNSQVLGMYDEMSVMYRQLDAYKHQGSRLDRSTLLDLYNGLETLRTRTNNLQNARLTLVSIAVRCSIIGSRRSNNL